MDKELKIRVVFDTGRAKAEVVEYAEGSIGALEKSLREAKLAMKDLTAGTAEHAAALVKLKTLQADVNDAYGRGITAIKNTSGASANAAVTLQALNYTVRDSPYFFRDFSLGILAVGNNLNPLIDGFIRIRQEAGSTRGAFKTLIGVMSGPQGVIFAFSMAVTILQAVTFAMAKNKSGANDLTKSMEMLNSVIGNLIEFENPFEKWKFPIKVGDIDKMITATDAEIKRLAGLSTERKTSFGMTTGVSPQALDSRVFMSQLTEEEKKRENANKALLEVLEKQKATLEAQRLIAERLNELGKNAESTEKIKVGRIDRSAEKDAERLAKKEFEMAKELAAFNNELSEYISKADLDYWKKISDELEDLRKQRERLEKERTKDFSKAIDLWVDEINVVEKQMSEAKTLANDLGTGLIQAFSSGASFVDSFVRSLEAAIAKMLVMLAIEQILSAIFPIPGLSAPAIPALIGGSFLKNMPFKSNSMELQKQLQTMNMNMVSGQPTILIQTKVPGLEFTKKIINPSQAKLLKGNVISGA